MPHTVFGIHTCDFINIIKNYKFLVHLMKLDCIPSFPVVDFYCWQFTYLVCALIYVMVQWKLNISFIHVPFINMVHVLWPNSVSRLMETHDSHMRLGFRS